MESYVTQVEALISKEQLKNIFNKINVRFYLQNYIEQKNISDKQYAQMLYQLADIAYYHFSLISSYSSDLIACACLQQVERMCSKNIFKQSESRHSFQDIDACADSL